LLSATASVFSAQRNQRLVPGQRSERVVGAHEGQTGAVGQLVRHPGAEFRMGVQAGADRGAADRQRMYCRQCCDDGRAGQRELGGVAGEFLAQRQRRGILQMGAADLDDVGEGDRLVGQLRVQRVECRHQRAPDGVGGGHVHGRREHVIRRLAHVHIVVRVQRARLAAVAAHQLRAAVGQHLVHIHIGLRAGAGLPQRQRKLVVMLAGEHLVSGRDDGGHPLGRQFAQPAIGQRRRALDRGQRVYQFARHALGRDREVLQRTLRLRAPQAVCRHLDRAEGIVFGTGDGWRLRGGIHGGLSSKPVFRIGHDDATVRPRV
jgi:hypothetical protein